MYKKLSVSGLRALAMVRPPLWQILDPPLRLLIRCYLYTCKLFYSWWCWCIVIMFMPLLLLCGPCSWRSNMRHSVNQSIIYLSTSKQVQCWRETFANRRPNDENKTQKNKTQKAWKRQGQCPTCSNFNYYSSLNCNITIDNSEQTNTQR